MLYLQYLEKQVDPELLKKITAKANAVEKAFNVFRAKVDGKEMTDSEVRKVLKESTRLRADARRSGRRARASAPIVEADLQGAGQAPQRGGARSSASRTSTPCMLTSTSRTATSSSSCSTSSTS